MNAHDSRVRTHSRGPDPDAPGPAGSAVPLGSWTDILAGCGRRAANGTPLLYDPMTTLSAGGPETPVAPWVGPRKLWLAEDIPARQVQGGQGCLQPTTAFEGQPRGLLASGPPAD